MQENLNISENYTASPPTDEIVAEVSSILNSPDTHNADIKPIIEPLHPADIAVVIDVLSHDLRDSFLQTLANEDALPAETLIHLENEVKPDVLNAVGVEVIANKLKMLDDDDALSFIQHIPEEAQAEVLTILPNTKTDVLEESLSHPEDSAGRIRDTDFITVHHTATVGNTIDFLRKSVTNSEDFYVVFVIDDEEKPVGMVNVAKILCNNREVKITEIMENNIVCITPETDREEIAHLFFKYALVSAPVVDEEGKIQAVITLDDIVETMREESTEDILKLGGVEKSDFYATPSKTAMQRFPWLFLNLLTAVLAAFVISLFEETISELVVLAVLMPIVASMSGNAGTQTLTVIVRSLATKELISSNLKRVLFKEVLSSIFNSIAFAVIIGLSVLLVYQDSYLATAIAASTIFALVCAALSGVLIPILLTKMRFDPAISSAVFLTTVTDVSSFFSFLWLASVLIL